MAEGFKLPSGARDRERFLSMLERIEALESRVAALEAPEAPDHASVDLRKEVVARAVALGIGEEKDIKRWPTDRIVKAVAKAEGSEE